MNKQELIASMATKSGLSKKDTAASLDAFIGSVTESLTKKEQVQLIGFATFSTIDKPDREGRNPGTGATIQIPATTAVKFKVGAALKASVAGK